MPTRDAEARWDGDLASGRGDLALGSGAFSGAYSFSSRFEDGSGTNPEELLGAALAGCYSMALANNLAKANHAPTSVKSTAKVHLEKGDAGFSIPRIEVVTEVDVPGLQDEELQRFAEETRQGCIVARALGAVDITVDAKLVG